MDSIFSVLSVGTKFKKKKSDGAAPPRPSAKQQQGRAGRVDLLSAVVDDDRADGSTTAAYDGGGNDDDDNVDDDANGGDEHDDNKGHARPTAATKRFRNEEEVNAFRNRMQIKVKGGEVPPPAATFTEMRIVPSDLKTVIIHNIEQSTWKEPTPIQMQAIPVMLGGRDLLASAPTGSGKTAAFLIPVLSKLGAPQKSGVRALVLAPTKELAEQIHREAVRLCAGRRIKISLLKKVTASAAAGRKDALGSVDLLVATPLRLIALLREGAVDLSRVEIVVLDEADKLFELEAGGRGGRKRKRGDDDDDGEGGGDDDDDDDDGAAASSFLLQIDEILSKCPSSTGAGAGTSTSKSGKSGKSGTGGGPPPATGLQRALFSATIGPSVRELAASFLRDPVTLSVGVEHAGASTIDQQLVFVGREEGKVLAIRQLIQKGIRPPVLLFLQSKDRAKDLFRELAFDGLNVDVMHAERTPQQREDIIRRFRVGDIWVLICTDLMARGVDFKGVQMVINYDLPQTAVAYIHRIGRTGRAGQRGTAVTFFTEEDIPRLRPIANVVKLSGCPVPDWMLSIKAMKTKDRKRLRVSAPRRRDIQADEVAARRHGDVAATATGGGGGGGGGGKSRGKKAKKGKTKSGQ